MSAPLRIALIAPFGLAAKGTTRARVLPLAKALAAQGLEAAVFIPPYDSPEDAGRRWRADGVDIINVGLPPAAGATPGPAHAALGLSLARAAWAWRPDVIHVFKPKGPSGLVGTLTWARRERPALAVDADDWEGPGGWNDDPRAGYSSAARRVFAWQERYGFSHADAWTVTSACLRERAAALSADPGRVFHLPNGVPAVSLGSAPERAPVAGQVLLYTRFAGVRAADVADVWGRVQALAPSARLTVVGRGLAGEEDALARLPGVEAAGWVAVDDLPGYFARAAIAILPWADTPANRARHSVKALELMAAGVPSVACAVGELPATLGETGALVPPGDAGAFARAVADLLADPQRAARLGEAARARVAAHFTWDKLAKIALQAYDAALARRAGAL